MTYTTIGRKKKDGPYRKEFFQQGCVYKNYKNFLKKRGLLCSRIIR